MCIRDRYKAISPIWWSCKKPNPAAPGATSPASSACIAICSALSEQIAIQALEAGDVASGAAGFGFLHDHQMGEIALYVAMRGLQDGCVALFLQPDCELAQVAPVAVQRVA